MIEREGHTSGFWWLTFSGGFPMQCRWPSVLQRITDCIVLKRMLVTYRSSIGMGWASLWSRCFLVYDVSWLFGVFPISYRLVREILSTVIVTANSIEEGLAEQQRLLQEVMPAENTEALMERCRQGSWVYQKFRQAGKL